MMSYLYVDQDELIAIALMVSIVAAVIAAAAVEMTAVKLTIAAVVLIAAAAVVVNIHCTIVHQVMEMISLNRHLYRQLNDAVVMSDVNALNHHVHYTMYDEANYGALNLLTQV